MQNCIGVACQQLDACFLDRASTIALHQDVSQLVLVVRFSACTLDLESPLVFWARSASTMAQPRRGEGHWRDLPERLTDDRFEQLRHRVALPSTLSAPPRWSPAASGAAIELQAQFLIPLVDTSWRWFCQKLMLGMIWLVVDSYVALIADFLVLMLKNNGLLWGYSQYTETVPGWWFNMGHKTTY